MNHSKYGAPRFFLLSSAALSILKKAYPSSPAPKRLIDLQRHQLTDGGFCDYDTLRYLQKERGYSWPSIGRVAEWIVLDGGYSLMELSRANALQSSDFGAGWVLVRTGRENHIDSVRRGTHVDDLPEALCDFFYKVLEVEGIEVEGFNAEVTSE